MYSHVFKYFMCVCIYVHKLYTYSVVCDSSWLQWNVHILSNFTFYVCISTCTCTRVCVYMCEDISSIHSGVWDCSWLQWYVNILSLNTCMCVYIYAHIRSFTSVHMRTCHTFIMDIFSHVRYKCLLHIYSTFNRCTYIVYTYIYAICVHKNSGIRLNIHNESIHYECMMYIQYMYINSAVYDYFWL